jgi:aminopeptidase YwaD
MASYNLVKNAQQYLQQFCVEIPNRPVGSPGNRKATDFFAQKTSSFGFQVEPQVFPCIDLEYGDLTLSINGEPYAAFISPYSLGCRIHAPLVTVSTLEQLKSVDALNKVLLIYGELTKEQLMPKNFPFYNPDEHKQIYKLLETKHPLAIITATGRNPELAGGMYPFPMIEDGDFDIPSIYMTAEEGERIKEHTGKVLTLEFYARRIPAVGYNIIARKGSGSQPRIVVCAHIDAKDGTPGAIDNAVGVIVLLLLAELMQDFSGKLGLELLAVNGEDYYSGIGEIKYLEELGDGIKKVLLAINIDAAGYVSGDTHYSLYDLPENMARIIHRAFSVYEGIQEGVQWYQSDHSIFIQSQRPAVAITSEHFMDLSTYITHTSKDIPEIVDLNKLMEVALALQEMIKNLNREFEEQA